MKPLVYFDFKESVNSKEVVIDKDKLRKMIDEIYQAGYDDGLKQSKHSLTGSSFSGSGIIPKGYYDNGSNSIEAIQTVLYNGETYDKL